MAQEKLQGATHKGPLAGLVGDEREETLTEALRQSMGGASDSELGDYRLAVMEQSATEGPMRTTLAEHLTEFTRDELVELAKDYELRGYSKLKKAELAQAVSEAVAQTDEAFAIVTQMPGTEFDTLREVAAQPGCMLEVSAEDARSSISRAPYEPWVYLYKTGEAGWTFLVPEELREALGQLDWDAVVRERELIAAARHVSQVLCDRCGIVRIEDAAAQFQAWYGDAWEEGVFESLMAHDVLSNSVEFGLWLDDDDVYLVNYELDERQTSPDDEDGAVDLEAFKKFLVEKHKAHATPQLDDDLRTRDYIDWALMLPASQALISFFDNHVPDAEEDELLYAEDLVEEIATHNGNLVSFEQTVADLDELDLCLTAQERDEMLSLLRAMLEELPYWESNGWSNNALRRSQGAAPAFFDDKGAAVKVGRNDPCPCGSGKKYKKCCGK